MTPRLLAVIAFGLFTVPVRAADPEPLTLADGKPYDPDQAYKIEQTKETGKRAWVTIAGFKYRAKPGSNAPPRRGGRETRFMEQAYVWEVTEVNNTKYLLLASVDEKTMITADKPIPLESPLGWVPADHVLAYISNKAPEAIQVTGKDEKGKPTETFVPQKGMIVNTMDSVIAFQKNPPPPLFTIPSAGIVADLAKNQFPDDLRRQYEAAGIKLGKVQIQPRLSGDGWVITEGESTAGNVFAARQQYDLFLKDGNLTGRENQNMAWVFDRPDDGKAYRRKSFVLSNVFFLFQKRNGFALIGSRSTVDTPTTAVSIHGWVKEDRLSFWNTAEALEWDYSTTLPNSKVVRPPAGYVFPNAEDAETWLTAHAVGETKGDPALRKNALDWAEQKFLAREPKGPDGRSRLYIGMEMRYPLLGAVARHPITNAQLYKVGWFGPFVAEGGVKKTEDRKLAERRQGILNAIQELNTVEMLFVIDGTPSMAEYRTKVVPEVVASSLRKFNEIRQSDDTFANLKVRVRVVLFGEGNNRKLETATFPDVDAPSGAGRANPAEIVSGDIPDIEKRITGLADWLRTQPRLPSQGPAGYEPVFDAVLEGFKTARFGNRTLKYVIVIGDAGDRSRSLNPRQGTLDAVIDNLDGKGLVPTTFFGIRAVTPGEEDTNSILLRRQFKVIQEEIKFRHKGRAGAEVFDLVGDSATLERDLGLTIAKQFEKAREDLRQADNDLRQYSEGVTSGPPNSPFLRAVLEANKVDVTELAAGGVQVYQEGYAYESTQVGRETVPQLRPVYLMPMKTARKLRDLLLDITDEGGAVTKDPAELKKFMMELLMKLINTDDPKEVAGKTISAEFRRKYGITFRSGFLDIPVDQIAEKISPEHIERLLLVARRLDELLKDETISEWKIKKVENGIPVAVREGPARKADKFYEFPGVLPNRWVWLDKELYIP